jgi:hypothetical protein
MRNKTFVAFCSLLLLFTACGGGGLDIPANKWIMISQDESGARRHSSFRYVDSGDYFLQWGFIGHITEFYGGPDSPPEETPEYDLVYFDPSIGQWLDHLPIIPDYPERAWDKGINPAGVTFRGGRELHPLRLHQVGHMGI